MVSELSGLDIANASLLDEATAAAEAMALSKRMSKNKGSKYLVDHNCLPQTIAVMQTRAEPMGIELLVADPFTAYTEDCFGVLLQYPGVDGEVRDFTAVTKMAHQAGALVTYAADILSLVVLKTPGEQGADICIGSTQRFGVPMGFGGPHAGFMAAREKFKRSFPGRLVGVSKDASGKTALRLALQTREQHIRREKATSNICTAQVLLAVIAGMYAVYHGPEGLTRIASNVHAMANAVSMGLRKLGFKVVTQHFFDTIFVETGALTSSIITQAEAAGMNLRVVDQEHLAIAIDETVEESDIAVLLSVFGQINAEDVDELLASASWSVPETLRRNSAPLQHEVFSRYKSETDMLRYIRSLSDKDLALDRSMIPLGSCTMKLNATSEMLPITWPEFANLHPLAPSHQTLGYQELVEQLEAQLCEITGYDAVSFQPNAGSQGEYAGLLAIRAYHESRGDTQRNICLIPSSAHGTNPATAQMCGMEVVVVRCDRAGNIDLVDLQEKTNAHAQDLAAMMITYPSTHGVFEENVSEVCALVHQAGGQVYIDGANLNAMVGLCKPGVFGGDVSHLNLHKTFCIPHGGGGPGVGPVAVKSHLADFLPQHKAFANEKNTVGPVSAAQFGSASILPITWMYIQMMGAEGLKQATQLAILNANYIARRLEDAYPVLYTGRDNLVAHECILDLRELKEQSGVTVEDVAKRLIDFGFHAPTVSFPVSGTLMIEPTESESLEELDRFVEAMLCIRSEIQDVIDGKIAYADSTLKHAPHTAECLSLENWPYAYSRRQAVFPNSTHGLNKYWPPVLRIDNVYGDKNLVCSCPSMDAYIDKDDDTSSEQLIAS
jgi:glycine dehydrogenase